MEKLQPLGAGVRIYVSDMHRFGTDAILLADFAAPKRSDVACDLGTGCGIIPLLWCRFDAPESITAIDIQPEAVELVTRSVALNGLENRVRPLLADLRESMPQENSRYSLVTMNPPYKTVEGGLQSPDDPRRIARHEVTCTVYDAAECASRLLKNGGRFCVCHRPERLSDLFDAMRKSGVEPKRLRLVCQRAGSKPGLILVEGKKGARAGMVIDPPFYIEDESGNDSPQMAEIYKEYRQAKEQDK